MKLFKTYTVCLLAVLLTACSNTFIYNQLDWLIPWYVDDYVDLTRDQKQSLKLRVDALLRWHRGDELASYIAILDRIEADLGGPLTAEDVEAWANLTLAAYERIEARILPVAFELGGKLSDEQMAEFIANLERGQRELEEEYLERSDEEYVEEAWESLADNLDDFLGRLTPEQNALIETAASSLMRFDAAWLEERARWLETLSDLLKREPGWQEAVMGALDARDRNRTEAYRSAYAHNAVIINDTIAQVLNVRTEKQTRRLQGELDDFRRDLRKLIAQAE
jgi:hypothetical protein